ncbi:redox-regulated ATPase YchF [Rubinisphaera italica]|uniref:Ribosome-binding ATPase YchF n=1 Tax=Rubinisphaera italica TaxID=2527969 RepID=A0A5C5XKV4_9PLAN|nr:redox-regulated ATPase YchF [Rubinisphaera italica]TWT63338.1 Ribosome-binding ATPase YchF [Rubinisphaera italica]
MEAGIVGLPNVGKSTLFNALTAAGIASENYPFCTIEPNVGVVEVPDPRLDIIHKYIKTDRVLPAALKLVDIAGIVKGASVGEGLGNKFLANIRDVDAIIHVVRCFENDDVIHVDGSVDPLRDVETIDTELILADLQTVESARDRSQKKARTGDSDAKKRIAILDKCFERLDQGMPIRGLEIDNPDDRKILRGFSLLTAKPVLYLANVSEDDLKGESEHVQALKNRAGVEQGEVIPVCAAIESELSEMDKADRAEMLADLGLEEPALSVVARATYKTLGYQSYFTAGVKEIRAWTIPQGATGPQAAGVIHTDFEKGFIRAEIFSIEHLEEYKSEKAIREAGKLRVEGKEYIMRDGDVCNFLVNP